MTRASVNFYTAGSEFLVIKFKLGTFMPYLPARNFLDVETVLPEATRKSFWLKSSTWQFPDYENVEAFVSKLVCDGLLASDSVVHGVLRNQPQEISSRTVRRRFLHVTGLTQTYIHQIERAQYAATLLEHGSSILDTVHQVGYASQPHMTRSLKHFIGQTPAQIVQVSGPK